MSISRSASCSGNNRGNSPNRYNSIRRNRSPGGYRRNRTSEDSNYESPHNSSGATGSSESYPKGLGKDFTKNLAKELAQVLSYNTFEKGHGKGLGKGFGKNFEKGYNNPSHGANHRSLSTSSGGGSHMRPKSPGRYMRTKSPGRHHNSTEQIFESAQEKHIARFSNRSYPDINPTQVMKAYNLLMEKKVFGTPESYQDFKTFFESLNLGFLSVFSYIFGLKFNEDKDSLAYERFLKITKERYYKHLTLDETESFLRQKESLMYDIVLSMQNGLELINFCYGSTIKDSLHNCARKAFNEMKTYDEITIYKNPKSLELEIQEKAKIMIRAKEKAELEDFRRKQHITYNDRYKNMVDDLRTSHSSEK